MEIRKKIIFISVHRKDRSPSQRFRFEQYIDFLEINNFDTKHFYLVSKEELMTSAENLAHEINSAGPLGVQAIRSTIKEGLADEIEKITQWELSEQNRLRETDDFKEGIKASLDRREPIFKSK